MMKHVGDAAALWFLSVFVGSLAPAMTHAGTPVITDPEKWYAESYGPLWHDSSWDKEEEILFHYHYEIWVHSADGERKAGPVPKYPISESTASTNPRRHLQPAGSITTATGKMTIPAPGTWPT